MKATKSKTTWHCSLCGHQQARWSGQCPQCSKWNTLQEEICLPHTLQRFAAEGAERSAPKRLNEVCATKTQRIATKIKEYDRLLGGGVVPGSLTLIGGDPGIGKSTLMLQLARSLAHQGLVVLYVCGEESIAQTSMRAKRLGIETEHLYLLNETNFSYIKEHIDSLKPDILIVDSIQVVYKNDLSSAPGSVSQVREVAAEFMYIAKNKGIAVMLIGHVTKSGEIAGPRVLEHLVDTVLYFEGDRQQNYRMVRVVKNRFGPTDEIAVFHMQPNGLSEVPNPSKVFLGERTQGMTGSVVIPTIEGSRPILIEVQALVTNTVFSTPSRRCVGFDQNRLVLLLAVLEKRMRYQMYRSDVFVSIAGGLKVAETGIDLGIVLAVTSSLRNWATDPLTAIVGEVGLGGEVRSVTRIESRIKEVANMGFQRCILPKRNMKGISEEVSAGIDVVGVETVEEAINRFIS